jgi:F5/8 type C domain.
MKSNISKITNIHRCSFFLALLFITGIFFLASCNKMRDNYYPYIKNGEIVFTGKVDSLVALPGRNRLQLKWLLVSDPKITKCKVFWNDGADSLLVPVQRTDGTDTIKVNINNLAEGLYTFEVYTYDDAGHSSVKAVVTGTVYGENYINSISNRALDSAIYHPDGKYAEIKWFGIAQQAKVVEVLYTDTLGHPVTHRITTIIVPTSKVDIGFADRDTLHAYEDGTTFKYRTGYLPAANAIDTFFTDYREISTTLYVPPVIPTGPANLALGTTVTASSSATQALTDGDRSNAAKWQPSSSERADLNVWFYVDLGSSMDINTTQVYFTKDPGKITYYEVLYTTEATITTSTKWTRAFIKLESPDAEDINTFTKVKARYVKVNIGLKDSGTNINVSELEVYNEP